MLIDDLHTPQFMSADVCRAAQIEPGTLKHWALRKPAVILLTDEERAEWGTRKRYSFNLLRVYQIAITAELVRAGHSPRNAAMITAGFTDSAPGPLPGRPRREIATLFPTGFTFLVATPGDPFGDVLNLDHDAGWREFWDSRLHRTEVALLTVINLNTVITRVRQSLGLPPLKIALDDKAHA